MFYNGRAWLCNIFGHKFQKVRDLRVASLHRERVVYRCIRCNHPLIEREKERRHQERRRNERRQLPYFQNPTFKYTT